jgi:hypothetical protein
LRQQRFFLLSRILMMRLWAGWFTAAMAASRAGRGDRPLLVVLDCKGGRDARVKAGRTRRLLYGAGARRVAIWPDEARLSLWDLPPRDLAVLLYQMIESGTGAAAYDADVLQAVLRLAITAPCGPPLNATSFLDRLDARWLQRAWSDGRHPVQAERARSAARHLPDIQLRYATLLERLGRALDGPGTLAEADAWYFILEGTREPSVVEAQAMAITELAAHAVTDLDGEPRAMLLAADDYSAVSRRVPVSNLYERGRSLGITQSLAWHDAVFADGRYKDVSRLYEFPCGRQVVLPLARRRRRPAWTTVTASWGAVTAGFSLGGVQGETRGNHAIRPHTAR